jgi:nucleotide-binding universal stress UspA family protein
MEARLRRAPLLALTTGLDHDADTAHAVRVRLDRHLTERSGEAPEVSVCSLSMGRGVLDYLADNVGLAQLVVVGADDPQLVPELTGPDADAVLHHTNCSVMSVRGPQLSSELQRSAGSSRSDRNSPSGEEPCP